MAVHLEIEEAVIASRQVLQADLVDGPVQFTVGANIGTQILENETASSKGADSSAQTSTSGASSGVMMTRAEMPSIPNFSGKREHLRSSTSGA